MYKIELISDGKKVLESFSQCEGARLEIRDAVLHTGDGISSLSDFSIGFNDRLELTNKSTKVIETKVEKKYKIGDKVLFNCGYGLKTGIIEETYYFGVTSYKILTDDDGYYKAHEEEVVGLKHDKTPISFDIDDWKRGGFAVYISRQKDLIFFSNYVGIDIQGYNIGNEPYEYRCFIHDQSQSNNFWDTRSKDECINSGIKTYSFEDLVFSILNLFLLSFENTKS